MTSGVLSLFASVAVTLLQHELVQVFVQNRVFDGVEDKPDIVRVYCHSEVMEERLRLVASLGFEPAINDQKKKETFINFIPKIMTTDTGRSQKIARQ